MKLFDSELQYLSELYARLGEELKRLGQSGSPADPEPPEDSILRNRELFSRIEQMNARVSQLGRDWEKLKYHLDPHSCENTCKLAAAVRVQAAEVAQLLEKHSNELRQRQCRLEKELAEVGRGARYLESVKPAKVNYPKFIDSLG